MNLELIQNLSQLKRRTTIYTDNSLNDVMSLKRTGDSYVLDELKNMFNSII